MLRLERRKATQEFKYNMVMSYKIEFCFVKLS